MTEAAPIKIADRHVGPGHPVYIIAEMSANHGQQYDEAVRIMHAMKESGADAVKIQTYTADTLTIDSDRAEFQIGKGTIWEGKNLYQLYGEAYTPWDWQPRLMKVAESLGMDFFSSPFDFTAVDFLEEMNVPVYKIASFEMVDIPLIRKVAEAGKPVIMSTGMATIAEIEEAVATVHSAGNDQLILLKCTSGYPAVPDEMNLRTIPDMMARFGVPVGLSDHTMGLAAPVAAVALGACVIEKHFTMDRSVPGPDSTFSLEPAEFKLMVDTVRVAEKALGETRYQLSEKESASRFFRRSLYIVKAINAGERFTEAHVRSIRPANGLPPREFDRVLASFAAIDIDAGTPLSEKMIRS